MLNKRVLSIIKRELKEKLLSRTFIFMTIFFPLFIIIVSGLPALLSKDSGNENVVMISENQSITNSLQQELLTSDATREGKLSLAFFTMDHVSLMKFLERKKKDMLNNKITGVVYVPESAMQDKKVQYYSQTPSNVSLENKLAGPINNALMDIYFGNKSLTPQELEFVRKGIDLAGFKVSKDNNEIQEVGQGGVILASIFTILLYLSLILSGQQMLQSVIEEKNNRIVEVVLSSVSPRELMTGKILGSAITSLIQMSIWLASIVAVASSAIFVLPKEFLVNITAVQIIFLLINFGIGLMLYLSLFGMFGAMFDNPQDAQSSMWPLMMLVIIPFAIAMTLLQNPNSPIANAAAVIPFSSVMVMPVKMALVEVPTWQLIVTVLLNVIAIFFIFPVAGKIYRVGILRTGKKPKWSEVIKWLKYRY